MKSGPLLQEIHHLAENHLEMRRIKSSFVSSIWNIFCAGFTILGFCVLFGFSELKGERPSIMVCNFCRCSVFSCYVLDSGPTFLHISHLHLSTDNMHIPSTQVEAPSSQLCCIIIYIIHISYNNQCVSLIFNFHGSYACTPNISTRLFRLQEVLVSL